MFIERCMEFGKSSGLQALITMHSWMFLSSYTKLREKLINNMKVISMLHLGPRAFEDIGGEIVQTTSWVMKKNID
jgi:type II restriction/modification system DNA methylase subunit YeeA